MKPRSNKDTISTVSADVPTTQAPKAQAITDDKKKTPNKQGDTSGQKNSTLAAILPSEVHEDLTAGRVYWFVMLVLVLVILTAGVQNVKQILHRHELYRELSQARSEHQRLVIEEQRLLIEQQTFSATPIVAKRAKAELMMDYPRDDQRITILAPTTEK